MKIDHDTKIEAIRQEANLLRAVPSDIEYPWEAASRLKRFFIEDHVKDTDELSEARYEWYAKAALRIQEPDWTGSNDQDAAPLHERFTS